MPTAPSTVSVQPSRSSAFPTATNFSAGSTARMKRACSAASAAYAAALRCPICQSPYTSFPRPQYFTPYGAGWPLRARCRVYSVSPP
ncbi:hypothetical protein [Kribbella sp. NPDC050459]|uniref:hypothetical protein n=1 Tax=Kribbella sp. NPDC050459 TaxID=3155785 RepID=UPI0033F42578